MINTGMLVAIVVAVLAVAFGLLMYMQKERSKRLQTKFGPEYDRVVDNHGNLRRAEEELALREKRVEKFRIKDLSPEEAARFATAWREEQARFVDTPRDAVASADRLVGELMRTLGYPVGDFEQRAADLSVDHPLLVENYRGAHGIAARDAQGQANTEDLRQAMVHYRALFDDLLKRHVHEGEEVKK